MNDVPEQRRAGIADELRPYVDRHETEGINALGERLRDGRPIPRAAFRAALRATLSAGAPALSDWRPRRLRLLVACYVGCGCVLLGVAAIGLAGAGPLTA